MSTKAWSIIHWKEDGDRRMHATTVMDHGLFFSLEDAQAKVDERNAPLKAAFERQRILMDLHRKQQQARWDALDAAGLAEGPRPADLPAPRLPWPSAIDERFEVDEDPILIHGDDPRDELINELAEQLESKLQIEWWNCSGSGYAHDQIILELIELSEKTGRPFSHPHSSSEQGKRMRKAQIDCTPLEEAL